MTRFTTGNVYYGHSVMQRIRSQRPSRRWRFQHWLFEVMDTRGFWTVVCVVVVAALAFGFVVNL